MTTIKYELGKPKKDKTRSISLILSHKGERKRIPTNIVIAEEDLYRNGKIKSHKVLKAINEKINILRGKLCDFEIESKNNKCDINIFLSYL